MSAYTAHILGPRGSVLLLDFEASDMRQARQVVRERGMQAYGGRGFSFTVRAAA